MTQLCWDMEQFKYWLDAIRKAGITMPVDVGVMPILDQAATLFASAFALDDRKLAEQFASIFMATLDGFAIQQVLHAIPKDDTSYADTLLDFFTTCVPYYIEKHRES